MSCKSMPLMKLRGPKRLELGFLLAVLVGLAVVPASAFTTWYWEGVHDQAWDTIGNWSDRLLPTPTTNHIPSNTSDVAWIANAYPYPVVDLGSVKTIGGLYVDADDWLNIDNGAALVFGKLDGSTMPVITNNGSIWIQSLGSWTSIQPQNWTVLTLNGTGSLSLNGNIHSRLVEPAGPLAVSFINGTGHTVRGGGTIDAGVENRGNIIADNGVLYINGNVTNTTGIIGASGSGNILHINGGKRITGGQILPTDGLVRLNNCHFVNTTIGAGNLTPDGTGYLAGYTTLQEGAVVTVGNGNTLALEADGGTQPTLVNNGTIYINSTGNYTDLWPTEWAVATLSGTGSVVLNGQVNSRIVPGNRPGSFINDTGHTIRGGGTINAALVNNGTIIADTNTLKFNQPVTGNGNVLVADNAVLELAASSAVAVDFHAGNLNMTLLAGLNVQGWAGSATRTVGLSGNLSFAMQDVSKWIWGINSPLNMNGGVAWQSLEIGGQDLGLVEGGFTNNFAIPKLTVTGSGTNVRLVDDIDNGHRGTGGFEVLYANELIVGPGATLGLNGKVLYTHYAGAVHRVAAGEGGIFGGGTILEGQSLAAAFSSQGLWLYRNGSWNSLGALTPDRLVSYGTKLVANFPGVGLYQYDGTTWTLLTSNSSVENLIGTSNKLYADFGSLGLWQYNGTWTPLSSLDADKMAANGDNLLATFSGFGLYQHDGTTWTQLSPNSSVENMVAVSGKIYADYGTLGLWKYDAGWTLLSIADCERLAANGNKLVVNFLGYGLWQYDGTSWTQLTANDTVQDLVGIEGNLYTDFGTLGLYQYNGAWTQLSSADSNCLGYYGSKLVANFAAYGLYEYSNGSWNSLTSNPGVTVMVGVDLP
jgi:hypothetical protein